MTVDYKTRKPLIKTNNVVGCWQSLNRPNERIYICPECGLEVVWTKSAKTGKSYLCDVSSYTTRPWDDSPGRTKSVYLPMSPHYKTCEDRQADKLDWDAKPIAAELAKAKYRKSVEALDNLDGLEDLLSQREKDEIAFMEEARRIVLTSRADAEAEAETKRLNSNFVGEVGGKVTVNGEVVKSYEREGSYGTTKHVIVETQDGDFVEAGGTSAWLWDVEVGNEVTMAGSVKKQFSGKDGKITVLTRSKGSVI